jgi:hypothetical protein
VTRLEALVIGALASAACRPSGTTAHQDARTEAPPTLAEAAIVDAAGATDAVSPPSIDEVRYCGILERAAEEAAAQARAILAEPEPSIYEADVLRATAEGPGTDDPRVPAILRDEGISAGDWGRFRAANSSAVARCRERYEGRLASYGDLFPRLEAIGAQSASFRLSAAHRCLPFDRLQRPLVLYDVEEGNCGRQVAVDGAGGIWTEGGCENGAPSFCRDEQLTAAGRARYRVALDRLRRAHPRVGDGGVPDCTGAEPEVIPLTLGARKRTFELFEPSGAHRSWALCPGAKLPRVFQDVLDIVQ